MVLEEKIITFMKKELQRFKQILSPDCQENFEMKAEDEGKAREGVLKVALHFLCKMEQQDLADKLNENELNVVCQNDLKRNLKNKLLKSDAAEKACAYLTSVLGRNPLVLTELDLSEKIPGDLGVKQFCALLEDSHCTLKKLKLRSCSITEEGCAALTSALTLNPSYLIELHLNDNELGDSGVKQISALLRNPDCKLQKLGLRSCSITEEGCAALTSALTSNPSHLIEMHLNDNKLGDSGVKQISALLRNPDCKLQTLDVFTQVQQQQVKPQRVSAAQPPAQAQNQALGMQPLPPQQPMKPAPLPQTDGEEGAEKHLH
ncbi:hypothetical protein ACEWY4_026998 [Coilia grayii]|uniref:Uncharacterized protein n=1 Tax=Coilia grayii TaxID=363190 RepID=A0ABD1IRP3_9TELE